VIRVVLDPGVLISALIGKPDGGPGLVLRAFVDDRIEVVASLLLFAELERVLSRPKLRRYIDERAAREYVERIRRLATIVDDPPGQPGVTRDPRESLLGLKQLQVGVIDEEPAAPAPRYLSQDPGLLEPRECGVDRRHAQPELRRRTACREHDAPPGQLVNAEG
jgi:putative PIN family toxin of toxin-antitoxin system